MSINGISLAVILKNVKLLLILYFINSNKLSKFLLIILSILTIFVVIYKINNVSSKYSKDTKEIVGIVTSIKKEDDKYIISNHCY